MVILQSIPICMLLDVMKAVKRFLNIKWENPEYCLITNTTDYNFWDKTVQSAQCNIELHQLLRVFAESRVAAASRAQGWEAGPDQLGKVMGEIRRALSVTVVRANAYCLLERLAHLSPGTGAAAKRLEGALRQEEKQRQDRQAFDLAWQSSGSCRVGRAFVP